MNRRTLQGSLDSTWKAPLASPSSTVMVVRRPCICSVGRSEAQLVESAYTVRSERFERCCRRSVPEAASITYQASSLALIAS